MIIFLIGSIILIVFSIICYFIPPKKVVEPFFNIKQEKAYNIYPIYEESKEG